MNSELRWVLPHGQPRKETMATVALAGAMGRAMGEMDPFHPRRRLLLPMATLWPMALAVFLVVLFAVLK